MDGYSVTGQLLKACGHPVRLQILEALARDREACVCHLEGLLGQRQAAISQHLSRLRQAGLVTDRRDGLNVFYSLAEPSLAELLIVARASADGIARRQGDRLRFQAREGKPAGPCNCPRCATLETLPVAR
jgi:DNA-binding transcriptional ArsR family regulator